VNAEISQGNFDALSATSIKFSLPRARSVRPEGVERQDPPELGGADPTGGTCFAILNVRARSAANPHRLRRPLRFDRGSGPWLPADECEDP
jgi:hypothetical protein